MNLLIIGNMAAGKTSLAKEIQKKVGGEYASIDELRKEHSDGTYSGEFFAWAEMLQIIQHPSSDGSIVEFSGTGKNAWFVRECIKFSKEKYKDEWLVVYCLCDKDILIERNKDRVFDIPFPYNFNNSTLSGIDYISSDLQKKFGTNYWNAKEMTVRTDQKSPQDLATEVLAKLA